MGYYISDTCDVTMKDLSDGSIIFTAEAQLASLDLETETEEIRGGIGSKTQYVIKSDKEIELTVRNATFDPKWLELQQGVKFEESVATITKTEKGLVVNSEGEVAIIGEPIDNIVNIRNTDGDIQEVEVTEGKIEIPQGFAEEGERLLAIYEEEVTGQVLRIDGDKFPGAYRVSYHTIMYNTATSRVVSDLYFNFFNATPPGSMELSFENGEAQTPETTFVCLAAPNSESIGEIVKVDRED